MLEHALQAYADRPSACERGAARTGWVEPEVEIRTLRDSYQPGDLKFDPLNMLPKDEAGIGEMQAKELRNGRLAMIAIAGMTVQELVTGQEIF